MRIWLPPTLRRRVLPLAALTAATGLGGCVATVPPPYYGYNYYPYYGYNYSYYGYNSPYYRYSYPSSYYYNSYTANTTYPATYPAGYGPLYSPYFTGAPMAASDNGRG